MNWRGVYDCIWSAEVAMYKSSGECCKKTYKLESRACFGELLREIRYGKYVRANVFYKVYFRNYDKKNTNCNLLSLSEIRTVLKSMQPIVPFTYKFGIGMWKVGQFSSVEQSCNIISMHLDGTLAQHIFVTTMLRVVFEHPYNVIARETFNIYKNNIVVDDVDFSKIPFLNLYFIVASSLGSDTGHGLVSTYYMPKLLTNEEFKKLLLTNDCSISVYRLIDYSRKNNYYPHTEQIGSFKELHSKSSLLQRCKTYAVTYKKKLEWK